MIQTVYCECGESSMKYGRCIGCKRVRPSSEELREDIKMNKKNYEELLKELEKAKTLEKEDEDKEI